MRVTGRSLRQYDDILPAQVDERMAFSIDKFVRSTPLPALRSYVAFRGIDLAADIEPSSSSQAEST